jgi:hypothetical protein
MKTNYLLLLFLVLLGCREKYVPQLHTNTQSFLVVEGFINSGTGPTTITLTKSVPINDTAGIVYEKNAIVRIEGKNNVTGFSLTESSPGVYTLPQLNINSNDQYRVYIKTKNGIEYVSDYSSVRHTPDIDSISWKRYNSGVQILANTHDNQNKTKYYQYSLDETWEFHSKYKSSLLPVYNAIQDLVGVKYRDPITKNVDTTIQKCWKNILSTNIIIGTTEKLSNDILSELPLIFIEKDSWKLSVLYSILVKQYAMSQEKYRYFEQLKKNTEQIGSIFDAQPSDNSTNLHCITDPTLPVIGFVEVSEEKQTRIFISNQQVPDWSYDQGCANLIDVVNNPDSLQQLPPLMIPTVPSLLVRDVIQRVYFAHQLCVDCTLRGVNKKPAFWP